MSSERGGPPRLLFLVQPMFLDVGGDAEADIATDIFARRYATADIGGGLVIRWKADNAIFPFGRIQLFGELRQDILHAGMWGAHDDRGFGQFHHALPISP